MGSEENSKKSYLIIYCLVQQRVYQSRVHEVDKLLDIWQGLQQSAVDSAIDGERVFAPVYGTKGDILSSDNMIIEWAVTEAEKQCC